MQKNTSMDQSPREEKPQSLARYIVLALALAFCIRLFIAAPYVVQGSSMEHTFDNWDYLITDRLSYDMAPPKRGDVIVFCLPNTGECSLLKRLLQGDIIGPRTLIKRVIGLPGETISVTGSGVTIVNTEHPEGSLLEEPYVLSQNLGGPSNITISLGEKEYFVLGDNRRVSSDSRVWGVLPEENIVGRVLVRLFPLSTISLLPGNARYAE